MAMQGIDVSSWQFGIDVTQVPCDFVIAKATGGTRYINPDCDRVIQQCITNGKPFGFYHYAREVGSAASALQEANYFVDNCLNYFGKGIPVLDWEEETELGVDWVFTFLEIVRGRTGVRPLVYMSKSVCREYDWSSVVGNDYGLWVAQYADNNRTWYQEDPWSDNQGLGAWEFAAMHQYSSTGRLEGWDGNLDLNIFYGDREAWNKYAGVDKAVPELELIIETDFSLAQSVEKLKELVDWIHSYINKGQ